MQQFSQSHISSNSAQIAALANLRQKRQAVMTANKSMAIRMMGDKEKFAIAKAEGNVELLLEMIQCDETIHSNTNDGRSAAAGGSPKKAHKMMVMHSE